MCTAHLGQPRTHRSRTVGEVESFEDFLHAKIANNEEGYSFAWLEKSEYSYLLP